MSATSGGLDGWLAGAARGSAYVAGLVATAWLAPVIAVTVTIAAYLSKATLPNFIPWHDQPAVVAGLVAGLLAWLAFSFVFAGFGNAMNANRGSSGELLVRLTELKNRLTNCREQAGSAYSGTACAEAASHRAFLEEELTTAGVRWIDATGYIAAWERLHRGEEVLFEVESRAELLADALHDERRLTDSTVDHADQLLALIAAAKRYLHENVLGAAVLAPTRREGTGGNGNAIEIKTEVEARATLREVRCAIDTFRDGRWDGIVRSRNQLVRSVVLILLAAYGFLLLAVVGKAPVRAIQAAMEFFAMGDVVGLFNRVASLVGADTAVEDYSLSMARLIATPIFAGLAAIIGVYLVGTLYSASLASVFQPGGAESTPIRVPPLIEIYDLAKYPLGLLVAAVFGLVPTLVIDRLQRLADSYNEDIKRTEPATSSPTPTI